ncbi:MAG: hypothetical protein HY077_00595 [Elusimicrobia bacterium]|nr:hypothetical protein [Elusimicrobiota bacterium]
MDTLKPEAAFLLIAALSFGQTGCSREYGKHFSSASPDGKHLIDVTEEIQAANDPDVLWQHVSLRDATRPKPILPGNLAVISCRKTPKVVWLDSSQVSIELNRSDGGKHFEMPPKEKVIDGVTVRFTVWKQ